MHPFFFFTCLPYIDTSKPSTFVYFIIMFCLFIILMPKMWGTIHACLLLLLVPHEVEKGPINSCSLVRPFVRSFVRDALFSALALTIFLIFGMKLGEHKWKKVTEPDFSKKYFDPLFWVKKGSKMGFLGFCEKTALTFLLKCCK